MDRFGRQQFLKDAGDGTLTAMPAGHGFAGPTVREIYHNARDEIGSQMIADGLIVAGERRFGSNAVFFILTDAGRESLAGVN